MILCVDKKKKEKRGILLMGIMDFVDGILWLFLCSGASMTWHLVLYCRKLRERSLSMGGGRGNGSGWFSCWVGSSFSLLEEFFYYLFIKKYN